MQAFLKAKPNSKDTTAMSDSSKLLRNPKVIEELERLQGQIQKKVSMDRERWLKGLCEVAEFNLASCFEKRGDDLEVKDDCLNRPDSHALASIQVASTTNEAGQVFRKINVQAHNKLKAYELIGKALGFLNDANSGVGSSSEEIVKAFVKMAKIAEQKQLPHPVIDVEEMVNSKIEGEE